MRIHNSKGFTIVELLIVIVVIGILAAITVVAYNGIQNKARTATVTTDLSGATRLLSLHEADKGAYPGTLAETNDNQGIKASAGTSYQYTATGTTFCLTATNGTISYKVSNTAMVPTAGGCAGHGVGGVAPIINLALNPSFETNYTYWSFRWYGTLGGAGTNSQATNGGFTGSGYLHKVWTAAGAATDNGFDVTPAGGSVVSPGATYTLSGYMRTNRSDYGGRPGITWLDSGGATIGSSIYWGNTTTIPANTWSRLTQTATAPAGAAKARLYFSNGSSISWVIGDTLDLDAVMFTEGSAAPTYADGASTNWVWTGPAHGSTSTGPAL